MKRPEIGELCQFIRTSRNGEPRNVVTACRIVGYDPEERTGLIVDWFNKDTGKIVKGSFISVHDLVPDEEIAIHGIERFEG